MILRRIINAVNFSRRINNSFDSMAKKDFNTAMQILKEIDIPERKIWYYELMMGECLHEIGNIKSSHKHFENLAHIILRSEFNAHEMFHVSTYLLKKYGYRSSDLEIGTHIISDTYIPGKVRDRIRRYMPLERTELH